MAVALAALWFAALVPGALAAAKVHSDFDCDGFEDLAIGIRGREVGAVEDAGAVQVLYGAGKGLRSAGAQFIDEDTAGVIGTPEENDGFGSALAAGDFDDDGCDDLAIGAPAQDVAGEDAAGKVHVIGGNASGLDPVTSVNPAHEGDYEIVQGAAGVAGTPQNFELYGSSLAAGDFNDDGAVDLGVGIPRDIVGGDQAGAVSLLYGGETTLPDAADQYFNEGSPDVPGTLGNLDVFGDTVAAGDIDGNGADDLAIGARGDDDGFLPDQAGAVTLLYGSPPFGIGTVGAQRLNQGIALGGGETMADSAEEDDALGSALTIGDFDADGFGDLAVGVPGEDVGAEENSGAVAVLPGGADGVTGTKDKLLSHKTKGMPKSLDSFDFLGTALAAGRFNGGAFAGLAVGADSDEAGPVQTAGSFLSINGSAKGVKASTARKLHQDSAGMPGAAVGFDEFGAALAVGRFDAGSRDDVAVAALRDHVGDPAVLGGSVTAVYADGSRGLRTKGARLFRLGAGGLTGTPALDDFFGSGLAGGRP
jgi:hypothetical protein